jgi:hypothetical protein
MLSSILTSEIMTAKYNIVFVLRKTPASQMHHHQHLTSAVLPFLALYFSSSLRV